MCFHVLIYIFCKFLCGFDHSQGKGLYPKGFGDCYQVEDHDPTKRLGQSQGEGLDVKKRMTIASQTSHIGYEKCNLMCF